MIHKSGSVFSGWVVGWTAEMLGTRMKCADEQCCESIPALGILSEQAGVSNTELPVQHQGQRCLLLQNPWVKVAISGRRGHLSAELQTTEREAFTLEC